MSGILGNLEGIAKDMGEELDRQNQQIDRIKNKEEVNIVHLEQANMRTKKLLRQSHAFGLCQAFTTLIMCVAISKP